MGALRVQVRRVAGAILGYLLGFLALAVFAAVAFGAGPPGDEQMLKAFRLGALLAGVELAVLAWRSEPANRLIVGANVWLIAGGLAALLEQWWWLRGYQRLGEASLFLAMATVGMLTTVFTSAGFVAVPQGDRARVLKASWALLAAVLLALGVSVMFRGDIRLAAVLPVIALSWLSRWLRHWARRPGSGQVTHQAPKPSESSPMPGCSQGVVPERHR